MDIKDLTPEILLSPSVDNALHYRMAKENADYFIENYVKIEDRDKAGNPNGIAIDFKLWPAQVKALAHMIKDRLLQLLKANQLGLTWLALAYASHELMFFSGYLVLCISETEIKAKELIRRVDFIFRHLPSWMITDVKNDTVPWYESTALTLTVHHPKKEDRVQEDSVIQAFASSPTAGASFTANLFILDEWALQQWAREIWPYVFPTINRPTGGKFFGISTIERGSLFEDVWKDDKNNFVKIFLGWFEDPRRDQDWYEGTVNAIGIDETRKHYPATVEEAFSIPGGAFFTEFSPLIHIKDRIKDIPEYFVRYRTIDYGMDMLACYWICIDTQGMGRIYREVHVPKLTISQAAYYILKASGAKVPTLSEWDALSNDKTTESLRKNEIARTQTEKIFITYAPPDLFNRASNTGRSNAEVWGDNGISLTKTSFNSEQSHISMSQWLHPFNAIDEQTGDAYVTARLTIDRDPSDPTKSVAPNLVHSLLNIQKDKNNPNITSDKPHGLTHSIASIRYFCTEYEAVSQKPQPKLLRSRDGDEDEVELMNEARF